MFMINVIGLFLLTVVIMDILQCIPITYRCDGGRLACRGVGLGGHGGLLLHCHMDLLPVPQLPQGRAGGARRGATEGAE
jgi:hypothetical protein